MPPGSRQNPLEPARLGCASRSARTPATSPTTSPCCAPPAALAVVRDVAELGRWVDGLLRDPARLWAMREAACQMRWRWHSDLPRRTAAALLEICWHDAAAAGVLAPRRRCCRGCCRRSPPSRPRVTARRAARPGWHAAVPVICCGNVTVGGAGKTTLALDLGARLAPMGGGALPAARLRRRAARATARHAWRHCRPGRRRGATAGRGRADLDRRGSRRQRSRGRAPRAQDCW